VQITGETKGKKGRRRQNKEKERRLFFDTKKPSLERERAEKKRMKKGRRRTGKRREKKETKGEERKKKRKQNATVKSRKTQRQGRELNQHSTFSSPSSSPHRASAEGKKRNRDHQPAWPSFSLSP